MTFFLNIQVYRFKKKRNQIRHHALLVLEENKTLNEQIEMQQTKIFEIQKQHIFEGILGVLIFLNKNVDLLIWIH